jgi:serine/threonine protein kinase
MRDTIRWMAPELMYPEKFGFTGEYRKQPPSRSVDTYALGMTIFEVSSFGSPLPCFGG